MGMLNQAPSSELLTTLIGKSTAGASLQDLADYIATTDAFTAEYPATQTAREFATEMFGKLITGGTLDAEINTAVIDLLEGLLIAGTTKAEGFVAVINFLADSANADHPDLGDIAQAFQNRADAAEYFSVTKELGGSSDAELAAAIASVTSDADTLTAANAAADSTATSGEVVAGQSFTLTTGIDEFVGNGSDNTFTAGVINEKTGADITSINSGDTLDGGAGTDTLNITATADNNTSLTGLTVKNIEVVNITGANNFASSTSVTTTDAPVAGTAPVSSIKINVNKIALKGQTDVLDLGDFVVAEGAAAGNEGLTVSNGVTSLAVEVADGASASTVASAIAAKINTSAAEVGSGFAGAVATAVGGKLTVTYAPQTGKNATLLDPAALTVVATSVDANKDDVTGKAGQVTTSIPAVTTTEPVTSLTATLTLNGIEHTLTTVATGTEAGAEAGEVDVDLLYAEKVDGEAADVVISTAEKNDLANTIRNLAVTKINAEFDTVTASAGDNNGEILLTSSVLGGSLPEIGLTLNDVVLTAADAADSQNVAGVTRTLATGALQEVRTITITDGEGAESYKLLIDGSNYGSRVIGVGEDEADVATTVAATLNAVLGDGSAIAVGGTVTVTAPTAGTPLPDINLIPSAEASDVSIAISRQNASKVGTTTTVTSADATVSGSQFAGADEVWLQGATSNNTNLTVTGSQIAGLSKVTGIDAQTFTLGTASTLALSGASTATGKSAIVKGGGTTLNIIGTGTAGFALTESNTTNKMETLAVDTSGTTVLTVSGMSVLESISQAGKGGLTVNGATNKVSSITGGVGADKLTLATQTAEDNVATAKDETVNATLSSGDGADTVVVTVSGAGNTTVETGAGADTIKVNHTATGNVSIDAGDGDDTVMLATGTGELTAKSTVSGGDGVDTLVTTGDTTLTTGDYTKLGSYATGFEKLTFTSATGGAGKAAFDASKVPMAAYTVTAGTANYFQEVANGTAFVNIPMVRAATDYLGAIANYGATGLTVETAGYKADTDAKDEDYDANYGQDISITHSSFAGAATYTVSASDVTLTIAAIASSDNAKSAAQSATLAGQMETVVVNLASARGTAAKADNGDTEYMANFSIDTDATDGNDAMQGLTSITVRGSGKVIIDTSADANDTNDLVAANLKLIDLSGMTDFENLNYKGESQSGTYANLATSTVTLNSAVAETVLLGGADDTVDTNSSVDFYDTISNFSLVATAITTDADDVIDAATSDTLDIETAVDNTAGVNKFVADDTAYSSLNSALLAVATKTVAGTQNVLFHAEGNTYVFAGDLDGELDSDDLLVELTGVLNLDQLINAIV